MPVYIDRPSLAFVHMPKTGGTFVENVMRNGFGGQKREGHGPAIHVDRRTVDRRVFGVLRDPWSWYESLYLHGLRDGLPNGWRLGRDTFSDCVMMWSDVNNLSGLGRGRAWQPIGAMLRIRDTDLAPYLGRGLWSACVRYWFGGRAASEWAVDLLLEQRMLGEQLAALLGVDRVPGTRVNHRTGHEPTPDWTVEARAAVTASDMAIYQEAMELVQWPTSTPTN